MSKTTNLQNINISLIKATPENVRTVSPDDAEDKSLISSIESRGIIQSLAVFKEGKFYYAAAGGRRLAACQHLVKTKKLPKDFEVPCVVVNKDEATDVSLTENYHRARMHPADEFRAFSKLVQEGNSIKSIAQEYGVTQKEVKQRLSLSEVNDQIIDAYKAGEIDLEAVKAFTLQPDKDKQLEFFKACNGHISAWRIREHFTGEAMSSEDRLAKFVGIAAYKKAGGSVVNDMFRDGDFLSDPSLVVSLAEVKLDELKSQYEEGGWKWCEATLETSHSIARYPTIAPDESKVPAALVKKLNSAREALETYEATCWDDEDGLTDEEYERIEAKLDEMSESIDVLEKEVKSHFFFSDEQKSSAGVQIYLSHDGDARIIEGCQKPSNAIRQSESDGGSGRTDTDSFAISQALRSDLRSYADQLTQLELIQNPEVASLLYQFELCYSLVSGVEPWRLNRMFSSSHERRVVNEDIVKDSPSYGLLEQAIEGIDRSWVKSSTESSFKAFAKLTPKKRLTLFGSVVALLASDVSSQKPAESLQRSLSKRTDFVRSDNWRPTAGNYFARITRPFAELIATKLFGKSWVEGQGSLKKKQFAEAVANRFCGETDGMTDKQIKSMGDWLPDELK